MIKREKGRAAEGENEGRCATRDDVQGPFYISWTIGWAAAFDTGPEITSAQTSRFRRLPA